MGVDRSIMTHLLIADTGRSVLACVLSLELRDHRARRFKFRNETRNILADDVVCGVELLGHRGVDLRAHFAHWARMQVFHTRPR